MPSSIQIRLTIHLAIPKKRQCIGSTITCRIGLKYDKRSNSDHLTLLSLTKFFLAASESQCFHSRAFCLYIAESFKINHLFIFHILPKLYLLLL